MEKWEKIKVDEKIKPLHFERRKPVELIIGKEYYVSFGNNEAIGCTLYEIDEVEGKINIVIMGNKMSEIEGMDSDGTMTPHEISAHSLFPDEIGRTPEEAVMNQVTP